METFSAVAATEHLHVEEGFQEGVPQPALGIAHVKRKTFRAANVPNRRIRIRLHGVPGILAKNIEAECAPPFQGSRGGACDTLKFNVIICPGGDLVTTHQRY